MHFERPARAHKSALTLAQTRASSILICIVALLKSVLRIELRELFLDLIVRNAEIVSGVLLVQRCIFGQASSWQRLVHVVRAVWLIFIRQLTSEQRQIPLPLCIWIPTLVSLPSLLITHHHLCRGVVCALSTIQEVFPVVFVLIQKLAYMASCNKLATLVHVSLDLLDLVVGWDFLA